MSGFELFQLKPRTTGGGKSEQSSLLSFASGPNWQIRAHLARRERRGDIEVLWRYGQEIRPGVVRFPYVRLRTMREVRRRATLRILGWAALAAGSLSALLAALWQARHIILTGVGAALLVAAVWLLGRLRGHSAGCAGLHCPGCRR